jgi:hypothetical protein
MLDAGHYSLVAGLWWWLLVTVDSGVSAKTILSLPERPYNPCWATTINHE